jgi:hypothetical protein
MNPAERGGQIEAGDTAPENQPVPYTLTPAVSGDIPRVHGGPCLRR